MQPSEVCRICGGSGLFLNIFDEDTKYSEDLEDCLSVKVKRNDGRSQVLCHKCLGTLSWCKAYVSKVDLIKKNNPAPSSKLCYSCRSAKGHLFPFPDKSVEKFQELFGLNVGKTKNLKICHECQFSLDCVNDLREKANTSQKLSRRGQHLQFEVTQKNASVNDLVCSLKNRDVKVDGSSRKSSRMSKSSKGGNQKQENGTTSINSDEEESSKRKSGPGKRVNDKKECGQLSKSKARDGSLSEDESPKESKQKRKRQTSTSSDTELNISADSITAPKSKRLFKSDENPRESRRSSRDSPNSKESEPLKKQPKLKDAKSIPSPKSKRQRLDKTQKQESENDSDSDCVCLAAIADSNAKGKQATESSKRSPRSKNALTTCEVEEDVSTSGKTGGKKSEKTSRSSSDKKSASVNRNNRSDPKHASRKVRFVEKKENVKTEKKTQGDRAANSRKKKVTNQGDFSDEDEPIETKKKKTPLQEYTCSICSEDFSSTVVGKRHELSHDLRFDKFELKLIRLSTSEIATATEKRFTKPSSKNESDDDDELWSTSNFSEVAKTENKRKEDAFDALFGSEAENKSSGIISSSKKDPDSSNSAEKTEDVLVYNKSDSEEEESESPKEVGESDQKSELKVVETDGHFEVGKPEKTSNSSEEKPKVTEKEDLHSQVGDQEVERNSLDLEKSDARDSESKNVELNPEGKIGEESNEENSESQEAEKPDAEKTSAETESERKTSAETGADETSPETKSEKTSAKTVSEEKKSAETESEKKTSAETVSEEKISVETESEEKNDSEGKDDCGTVTSSQDEKAAKEEEVEPLGSDHSPSKKVGSAKTPESDRQDLDSSVQDGENSTSNNIEASTGNTDLNSSKLQD